MNRHRASQRFLITNAFHAASWTFVLRVLTKTALFLLVFNLLFAWVYPMDALGAASLYNRLWPARLRLPYGEDPTQSYNISLYNMSAMFHSHILTTPKKEDEFRIVVIGDSATWGWFLENQDTLTGQLNAQRNVTKAGKRLVFYNLGYPVMSLTKDLLLLDKAMDYHPDLIVWPVTLESFARSRQLDHPLLQHNPERVRRLISTYQLDLDPDDPRFVELDFWDRTILKQRQELANLLRLQSLGLAWAATGRDQYIPDDIPLRKSDFKKDLRWKDLNAPTTLDENLLALDVLAAGIERAKSIPVIIVNEPMFISQGLNSDLRYNSFYPRWAYDQYRKRLAQTAQTHHWDYLDLWNVIPAQEFTDTPVHLSPKGAQMFADILRPAILERANQLDQSGF